MKRYELEETDPPGLRLMVENPKGKWVRASDAEFYQEEAWAYRQALNQIRDCLDTRFSVEVYLGDILTVLDRHNDTSPLIIGRT